IAALLIGGWAYIQYRDRQAQSELAAAIEKYNEPVRPAGTPDDPSVPSFSSADERSKVTNAEFTRIADKYSLTQSGNVARYFAGVTFHELGNNASAEKDLKQVADGRYKEIASLAKLALASIYKDLADHPTDSVGKSTAQFQLAELYTASGQPDLARALYQQMQKESPASPVAQLATQKLQAMK